jgi:hypothetical protein
MEPSTRNAEFRENHRHSAQNAKVGATFGWATVQPESSGSVVTLALLVPREESLDFGRVVALIVASSHIQAISPKGENERPAQDLESDNHNLKNGSHFV